MWEGFLDGLLEIMLFVPRHIFASLVDLILWGMDQIVVTDDNGQEVPALVYLNNEAVSLLNEVPMLPFMWNYLDMGFGLSLIGGIAVVILILRRLPGF